MNPFNLPSVDHLIEGIHYTVLDWNFAEDTEANILRNQQTNMPSKGGASTFAESCPEGEKMVFGICRKVGEKQGEKEFDSSKKSKQEEEGEAQAKKEGSNFQNNKMITDVKSGKKMGWAMKNGKPVLVEYGSVAGMKKVGPKKPTKPSNQGVTDATRAGQRAGNATAVSKQVTQSGIDAQRENLQKIEAQTRRT